jgi:hypothetical protein
MSRFNGPIRLRLLVYRRSKPLIMLITYKEK